MPIFAVYKDHEYLSNETADSADEAVAKVDGATHAELVSEQEPRGL